MSDTTRPKVGGDKLDADEINQDLPVQGTGGETITGATLPVAVYVKNADGELYACDADDADALDFIGFVVNDTTNGNPATLQKDGVVIGFTGLTIGSIYYVQDDKTIGVTPGTNKVVVGRAISATQILINVSLTDISKIFDPTNSAYLVLQIPPIPTTDNFVNIGGNTPVAKGGYMSLDDTGGSRGYAIFNLPRELAGGIGSLQFDATKTIYIAARVAFSDEAGGGFGFVAATNDVEVAAVGNSVVFSVGDSSKLYAKSSDTSTAESNEITGISLNDFHDVMIKWIQGTSAAFYVDGVLKFTHTTNIPTAAAANIFGIIANQSAFGGPVYCSAIQIAIEK